MEPKYLFINIIDYFFIDYIVSSTHSTQDLVVPINTFSASTTLVVRILQSSSIVHGEKPEKFNEFKLKRWQ